MSRGAWVLIIGVLLLVAAGGFFAYTILGFVEIFVPQRQTLDSGEFFTKTVVLQEGGILTYQVIIQNYTAGDELAVLILDPGEVEVDNATVTGTEVTRTVIAESSGAYSVVIQNSGASSVTFLYFAGQVDVSAAFVLLGAFILGIVGFIVIIVGIVLLVVDRKK